MRITFLGTSSGTPTRDRNVSAVAVQPESGKDWILVDCGEATQHQLLKTELSAQKLRAVLITHVHGDHCYGLPGLLASCQMNSREAPLVILAPGAIRHYLQAVMQFTELTLRFPIVFIALEDRSVEWLSVPGEDELLQQYGTECVKDSDIFSIPGFNVSAWPLSHRVPCWGFRLEEQNIPLSLNVAQLKADGIPSGVHYGRLQNGEDVDYLAVDSGEVIRLESARYTSPGWQQRRLVIAGDNDHLDCLTEACRDVSLLIHEATYTEDVLEQVGPAPQHSSALRVGRFASENNLPALILTHFSPRYLAEGNKKHHRTVSELEQEAGKVFQGNLMLARDFRQFVIQRSGQVVSV